MYKLHFTNSSLLKDTYIQLAIETGEIDVVDGNDPEAYQVELEGTIVKVSREGEVFEFPWTLSITDDVLVYDGIGNYNNRPYTIICLEKNDILRGLVAQFARENPGHSVILDCPEQDRLSLLQQSKLSVTLGGELTWSSLAQGCVTFVDGAALEELDPPFKDHMHYVTYKLDDPHMLMYNLIRFAKDSGHSNCVRTSGYELATKHHHVKNRCRDLVEKIKALRSRDVVVFIPEDESGLDS